MNTEHCAEGGRTLSVAEMQKEWTEEERKLRIEQGLSTETDDTKLHIQKIVNNETHQIEYVQTPSTQIIQKERFTSLQKYQDRQKAIQMNEEPGKGKRKKGRGTVLKLVHVSRRKKSKRR